MPWVTRKLHQHTHSDLKFSTETTYPIS